MGNNTALGVFRWFVLISALVVLIYYVFLWQSQQESAILSIREFGVAQGGCPLTGNAPGYNDHVFRNEPFSVVVKVEVPDSGTYKQVKISTGIDSRGAHGQTKIIDSVQSGELMICAEGFTLDWPMKAQLRVELFEEGVWKTRRQSEYAVVHRARAEAVFMPLFSHTSVRVGFPRRVDLLSGDQLVMQAGVYVANGTAATVTLGPGISGEIYGLSSWQVSLNQPVVIEPFSVSDIKPFLISTNEFSETGQKLLTDKVIMLAKLQGDYTSPIRIYDETDVIDWKTLPGIGVDLVFVGNFSAEIRKDVQRMMSNEVNGYLQGAQIKLHTSSKRVYTAEDIGITSLVVDELKDIDDGAECAQLSVYQPSKGRPRMTVYFTEGLFAAGFVGCYPGGSSTPVYANTPFRSPIVKLREDYLEIRDGDSGFYLGREFFASVIAHEFGHALGLGGHTNSDSCGDTDHTQAADSFNLMFFGEASYSRILSPCQVDKIRDHSEFFRY